MNLDLKKIMVPVDGSDHAMRAAEYAAKLAQRLACEVLLLNTHRPFPVTLGEPYYQKAITKILDKANALLNPYRALFEAAGMTYHGVDLRGNIEADSFFVNGGATTAADGSYDIAMSISVLEHVDDPTAYLLEAHRVLRPDGHLVLATHGIWIYHPDPEDYWRWSCEGLKREIETCGFRVVDFQGSVGLAAAGFHLIQDSFLRKIRRLQWPILGRLLRLGLPVYALVFQLMIAFADSLSSDHNRRLDAMGFFVIARAERCEAVEGSGRD